MDGRFAPLVGAATARSARGGAPPVGQRLLPGGASGAARLGRGEVGGGCRDRLSFSETTRRRPSPYSADDRGWWWGILPVLLPGCPGVARRVGGAPVGGGSGSCVWVDSCLPVCADLSRAGRSGRQRERRVRIRGMAGRCGAGRFWAGRLDPFGVVPVQSPNVAGLARRRRDLGQLTSIGGAVRSKISHAPLLKATRAPPEPKMCVPSRGACTAEIGCAVAAGVRGCRAWQRHRDSRTPNGRTARW